MKLLFLGSAAAFATGINNYQSNMLIISEQGKKFLIDCGSDARYSLFEQGCSYSDIDSVYVSHLHSDHVGGLEWLGFSKRFSDQKRPDMFIGEDLVNILWENVLKGGMSCIEHEESNLESFFDVKPVAANGSFYWEGIKFTLVPTFHVINNETPVPSYGLLIEENDTVIFITLDTKFSLPHFQEYYDRADMIFHDCETLLVPTGVHSHYKQLATLNAETKSRMWLYDYNAGALPDADADGFLGFIKKGQLFST